MFDFSVLNVVIGLITIFLLYSLFASALQEAIANLLQRRANMLYVGIKTMLSNTPDRQLPFWAKLLQATGIWKIVLWIRRGKGDTKGAFAVLDRNLLMGKEHKESSICLYQKFYEHPIIKNYGQSTLFSKPSYLSNKNFATILIDVIKNLDPANADQAATMDNVKEALHNNEAKMDHEVVSILKFHLNGSGSNLSEFQTRLEQWFRDTMYRVSGWYTKNTHYLLFVIGICMAVLFNLDAIGIATNLSQHGDVARQLASMGGKMAKDSAYSGSGNVQADSSTFRQDLAETTNLIGLGWNDFGLGDPAFATRMRSGHHGWWRSRSVDTKLANNHLILPTIFNSHKLYFSVNYILYRLTWKMILGFLVTAIAIGLGAPFWFDLLNKFVNLRSAGVMPKSVRKTKP